MPHTEVIDTLEAYNPIITELLTPSDAPPLIIALSGDLGSGKTTFVQCLGGALGVSDRINSPTFTIMQSYTCDHSNFERLVHIDAYRFETETEVKVLDLPTVFTTPKSVVCIEWPERLGSVLTDYPHWKLTFSLAEGETRRLTIERSDQP